MINNNLRNIHQIIFDLDALKEFIEWLPDLQQNERFYMVLLARSKYCKDIVHISSDKQQLRRIVCRKESILTQIMQMECPLGSYIDKKGTSVPQEALALYISVNPVDIRKALPNIAKLSIDMIERAKDQPIESPNSMILSEIHKSHGQKKYITFDYDYPAFAKHPFGITIDEFCKLVMRQVRRILLTQTVSFLRTRGGLHVLIDRETFQTDYLDKHWYQRMCEIEGCDQKQIDLLPVVGCYQGGHIPYFIKD